MILTLLDMPLNKQYVLHGDARRGDRGFIHPAGMMSPLLFRDLVRKFGRFTMPIARYTGGDGHSQRVTSSQSLLSTVTEQLTSSWDQMIGQDSLGDRSHDSLAHLGIKDDSSFWPQSSETVADVTIGHVLHEIKHTRPFPLLPLKSLLRTHNIPRTFNPMVPGLSEFFAQLKSVGTYNFSKSVVFHYIPSPWTVEGHISTASCPELRINMSWDASTRNLGFRNIVAQLKELEVDVMMADRAVDLRFSCRQSLKATEKALQDSEVQGFMKQVQESAKSTGHIRAPPSLQIRIPQWSISDIGKTPEQTSEEKLSGSTVLVPYLYAGMEQRSRLDCSFRDLPLSYIDVRGEQPTERGAFVRLQARKNPLQHDMKNLSRVAFELPGIIVNPTGKDRFSGALPES